MIMENQTTAKAIRQLRNQKAWTQEQLAEQASISVRTIQRAEEGVMSAETLNVLAQSLGVKVETLSQPVEPEYPAIIPVLFYQHASTLEWLERVFGLHIDMRYLGQDGSIQHAELSIGGGRIMVGQPLAAHRWTTPEIAGVSTQSLYIMLSDIDQHYLHTCSEGGVILSEPEEVHGHRRYLSQDPEGHHWWFAAPLAK